MNLIVGANKAINYKIGIDSTLIDKIIITYYGVNTIRKEFAATDITDSTLTVKILQTDTLRLGGGHKITGEIQVNLTAGGVVKEKLEAFYMENSLNTEIATTDSPSTDDPETVIAADSTVTVTQTTTTTTTTKTTT